jgi:uncharacterized protein (TIGR02246 family)
MRDLITGCLMLLLLAGCAAAPQESAAVAAADARSFWSGYIEAELAADVDALVSLHADDAYIYPADGSIVRGHDEIRALIGGYFPALRATNVDIVVEDVWVTGDTLLHTARYHEVFVDAEGNSVSDSGRFFAALVADATGSRVIGRLLIQSTANQ